jgi:hypothetical protein
MVRDLASAVAFAERCGVFPNVHPALLRVSARELVLEIGAAPDARFVPPEGSRCPAWSIGCVLHQLITGRAPVTARDAEAGTEMLAVVRCLGAPTMSESRALGIQPVSSVRPRARVRGASAAERLVLRSTLAWDPARRMVCTERGLVSALERVPESEEDDEAKPWCDGGDDDDDDDDDDALSQAETPPPSAGLAGPSC